MYKNASLNTTPDGTGGSTEVRTGWNTWDDLFQKYNLINNITEFDAAKGKRTVFLAHTFAPFPAVVVSLCQVFLHRILFAFKVVSFFSSALLVMFSSYSLLFPCSALSLYFLLWMSCLIYLNYRSDLDLSYLYSLNSFLILKTYFYIMNIVLLAIIS